MLPDDLLYNMLQISLVLIGLLLAFSLRKLALTNRGIISLVSAGSLTACVTLLLSAPHYSVVNSLPYRTYELQTAASRFFMGLWPVGGLAFSNWLKQKSTRVA